MKNKMNKNTSITYKKGITRELLIKFVEDEVTSIDVFCLKYNVSKITLTRYLKKTQHNTINISLWDYYKKFKDNDTSKTINIDRDNSELNSTIGIRNLSLGINKATKTYSINLIQNKYLEHGLLQPNCYNCGYSEYRVFDYKKPLLLNFKNDDRRDLRIENLELLCYNCYFILIGDILNNSLNANKKLKTIEDLDEVVELKRISQFDLSTDVAKKLDLDIYNKNNDNDYDDPYSLVSYNI